MTFSLPHFSLSLLCAIPCVSITSPKVSAQGPLIGIDPVPPVPVPIENPITEEKRILGKVLFWDEQLSSDNTTACGTCHVPELGGIDPRNAPHPGMDAMFGTADDVIGSVGVTRSDASQNYAEDPSFGFEPQNTRRNSQNYFGNLWTPTAFWDGRATGEFVDPETGAIAILDGGALESQAVGPIVSDVEMGHTARDWSEVTTKLTTVDPLRLASNLPPDVATALAGGVDYPALFQAAFGSPDISATRIAFAIATYERTLVPDQTPWDAYNGGNLAAMTPAQVRGWEFFANNACATCHSPPLFNDNRFHNIGLRPWQEDEGRKEVTGANSHRGRFKTPTVRNVKLRPRLMHVGWITSVMDALEFYRANTSGNGIHTQFADGQQALIAGITIPDPTMSDLVDFLENGLTDPRVENNQFPFDRPTLLSERMAEQPIRFGINSPGTNGLRPNMIAQSQLVIRNPDFRAGIYDALPGAPAILLLAGGTTTPASLLGSLAIHVDLTSFWAAVPTTISPAGTLTLRFAIGNDVAAVGLQMVGQWFVADAGAPIGLSGSQAAIWTLH